jgi:hypothetical protein
MGCHTSRFRLTLTSCEKRIQTDISNLLLRGGVMSTDAKQCVSDLPTDQDLAT